MTYAPPRSPGLCGKPHLQQLTAKSVNTQAVQNDRSARYKRYGGSRRKYTRRSVMTKNMMNPLVGSAMLLIALAPLSVFAMGKKPPTEEALKKLYTQNFQCDVVSAESRTNGELTGSLKPGAPATVTTTQYTVASTGKTYKSIVVYLQSPAASGPHDTANVGADFEISADTVQQYDADALILAVSESWWKKQSLEMDFKSGEGKLEVEYTWGWEQRHDTEEAIFKNCKAL